MLSLKKIKEIVHAWGDAYSPTLEMKEKAQKRYSICLDCSERKVNSIAEYCDVCKCPLKAKVYSRLTPEEGACPKFKWKV